MMVKITGDDKGNNVITNNRHNNGEFINDSFDINYYTSIALGKTC